MKEKIILLFIGLLVFQGSYSQPAEVSRHSWADSVLHQMSLDEKIGQLFMIAAYSNKNENYENELEKQIRQYHVGGLIFFQGKPTQQIKLTNRYQKAAKYPLMIGMDAEHGVGWRLETAMEFPKMLTNGAIRKDSLIYALGATIARHCQELGVHVNFAPVVDINSNPRNPIIGMRSFGEDPEEVTQKAILYAYGSLSQNVLPVIKHFPGHGDTDTDSHHTLPVIPHSRQRLDSVELYPYQHLIEAGIPAVMVSHLAVKSIDSTGIPASLSSPVIQGLLRRELNFSSLCFTDAMNMKGVTQNSQPGEAEVKALLAGNDMLLFPANLGKAVEAIKKALADSLLDERTIDEKCRKILEAKQKYVLPNVYPAETPGLWSRLNSPTDIALKQQLYQAAITLIKNTDSLLPLKRLDTLRIASLNFGARAVNNFQTTLERYTQVTHFVANKKLSDEELRNLQKKLQPFNCIIIYNNLSTNSAQKDFGYSPVLDTLIRQQTGKRIILCHPGIPYGLASYASLPTDALLLSYENHLYAQQYAAQAIFGGIAMTARLPVCVNPDYPAGTGIQTPKTRLSYTSPEMCRLDSEKLAKIDSICQLAVQAHATPGCQVLIAKDGNIFYNKAFGHHTYKQTTPNKTSDIYDLASVTKITATLPAIIKLYDSRKINLAAPLSDYYPPLKETDKKDITVQEVLCHNAGLKTFLPLFTDAIDPKSLPGPLFTSKRTAHNTTRLKDRLYVNLNYRFKDSTVSNSPKPGYKYMEPGLYMFPAYQDTIRSCILHSPLNPKKEYAYSDLGFILLKFAVEHVTEKSLDQYCQEEFYRKLGMHHTDFLAHKRLNKNNLVPSCVDKLYRKTELKGYVHDPIAALLGGIAGHAGLFSTAEDLAKMMQLYLNGGTYGGEYYFSPETMVTFSCKNNLFPKNRRGLGFDKPEPDQTKINPVSKCLPLTSFGHTGFTGIMAWCDPDNKLLYLFLSNRTYPDEFNTKLSEMNIRTQIQDIIYQALEESKIRYN